MMELKEVLKLYNVTTDSPIGIYESSTPIYIPFGRRTTYSQLSKISSYFNNIVWFKNDFINSMGDTLKYVYPLNTLIIEMSQVYTTHLTYRRFRLYNKDRPNLLFGIYRSWDVKGHTYLDKMYLSFDECIAECAEYNSKHDSVLPWLTAAKYTFKRNNDKAEQLKVYLKQLERRTL